MDNTTENGNRSGDGLFGDEAEKTKHGETAVVDLSPEAACLLVLTHVLAELEGVVEVEGNRVRDAIRAAGEVGEVAGLSTTHVMLVLRSREFTPELEESDEAEDLPLGRVTDGIPESRRVGLRGERGSIHLHGPGELDSIRVYNVPCYNLLNDRVTV